MSAAPAIIDATRCPLCGGDNRCAVELSRATGAPLAPCWCMDVGMSAHAAKALQARLPAHARGLACICTACMTRLLEEVAVLEESRP
mgnify:FL=1